MSKWYAVRKGRHLGLFRTWGQTQLSVNGFPGAEFKSFKRKTDADNYLNPANKTFTYPLEIYTDGSCIDQQGGVGVVVVKYGKRVDEVSLPVATPTTNNECELLGLLHGCLIANTFSEPAVIFTDSKYSLKAVTVWVKKWERNGWVTSSGKPVKNKKLIQRVRRELKQTSIQHVPGHSGCHWNEIADQLANEGRLMSE